MSKKSFYCWYLGFTEAYGQQGQNRVYDLIKNLTNYQNNPNEGIPPSKVTLHLNEHCMTLIDNSQVVPINAKKQRNKPVEPPKDQKSYSIGYDKITFVGRLADKQYSDIITCIVRNENLTTKAISFYLHGFRFDSQETAKKMEQYLNYFRKLFFKKAEKQLQKQKEGFLKQRKMIPAGAGIEMVIKKNEPPTNSNLKENFIKRQMFKITDHFNHTNSSGGTRSSASQNEIYYQGPVVSTPPYQHSVYNEVAPNRPKSPKIYEDIHSEIASKIEKGEVFLFPPKDYSEVMREKRGNLKERDNRRCLNEKIVGELAIKVAKNSGAHDTENELYLNLSSRSYNNETEINTNRTDKSVDLNSLSFNEQATQVLNYFDEIVDSVDTIYKPPIESSRSVYKYEPPKEGYTIDSSGYTPRKQQQEPDYEPYEPLTDNYQAYKLQNNIKSVENSFLNKRTAFESNFLKKNKNINDLMKLKKQTTSSDDMNSTNIGFRTNALPVLGNYKPKMYGNIQSESSQVIYRPLGSSNKENRLRHQQRNLAASDESIYNKKKQSIAFVNMHNSNDQIYEPNMNMSLTSLDNEQMERNEQLRATKNNNSKVYVSQNNYNSQFILKPAMEETRNHKNYVHVENSHMYNSPRQPQSAVINIYGSPQHRQQNRNVTSGSYPINDIYY